MPYLGPLRSFCGRRGARFRASRCLMEEAVGLAVDEVACAKAPSSPGLQLQSLRIRRLASSERCSYRSRSSVGEVLWLTVV